MSSLNNKVKVFDCVNFFNEHELFDLRYEILKNHVDYFIVIESNYDFNKNKKKYCFNIKKYPKDKIRYLKVNSFPKNVNHKKYSDYLEEYYMQRKVDGLWGISPCDIVLISGLDEIPHPDSIKKIVALNKYNTKIGICYQKMVSFNFNFQIKTGSRWFDLWPGTKFARYHSLRVARSMHFSQPSLRNIFNYLRYNIIFDKGCHFNYLGGKNKVIAKYLAMHRLEERFKREQGYDQETYYKKKDLEKILTKNLDSKNDLEFIKKVFNYNIKLVKPKNFYDKLFYSQLKKKN